MLKNVLGARTPSPQISPHNDFDDYELLHELGRGAMGVVWLARECTLDRLVALKLLPTASNPSFADRLLREGKAIARLRHPHILTVHALGRADNSVFLAMDFIEGGSLDSRLRRGCLEPLAAAKLVAKLAGALAHAHGAGLLHRDIKPSNILLTDALEPVLADFGLAVPLAGTGELTANGVVVGTPAYLAPELLKGAAHASPQSDIYGLGAVLYTCLTGRPPFVGDSVASLLAQVAHHSPESPRDLRANIPLGLESICLQCLAKDPQARFVSAALLQEELHTFLASAADPTSSKINIGATHRRGVSPSRWFKFGGTALLVFAIGLGFWSGRARSEGVTHTVSSVTEHRKLDPSAPLTATQLAAKADALFTQNEGPTRVDLQVAEDYCKQALALDANDPDNWAVFSRLCVAHMVYGYDVSDARYEAAGNAADRAVRLAPQSFEARFALANYYRIADSTQAEGERRLRALIDERSDDKRVLRTLAHALRYQKRFEDAMVYYRRAHSLPGGDPLSLVSGAHTLSLMGRQAEADAMIDQAIALEPSGVAYLRKLFFLLRAHADLPAARALLDKVPMAYRRDDRGAYFAFLTWYWSREPEKALEALSLAPRNYLEDWYFTGPVSYLRGLAHRQAGRMDAAQIEWKTALQLLEMRLAPHPNDASLLLQKAAILAYSGNNSTAETTLAEAEQLLDLSEPVLKLRVATIELALGHTEQVVSVLTDYFHSQQRQRFSPLTRAQLRIDPDFDALRSEPRFIALVAASEPKSASELAQASAVSPTRR